MPNEPHPIELSSKTLVHISSGIYRSSANALKELVSNAFDADAEVVRINTNFPQFDVLTCSDNGSGMTRRDFEHLMAGIGSSNKRVGEAEERNFTPIKKRPIIGRIGIGMLAIAQICYEFTITSHHSKSETAFEAVLNLKPPRREDVTKTKVQKKYKIGSYVLRNVPYDAAQAGLHIVTRDLLDTYTRRYREDIARTAPNHPAKTAKTRADRTRGFLPVPLRFTDLYAQFGRHRSVRELGEYWRLFWELSFAAPIAYLEDAPIRQQAVTQALKYDAKTGAAKAETIIREIRKSQEEFDFEVLLDNVSLRKPMRIPRERDTVESRLTPLTYDAKVRGTQLKFRGYIYSQNKAIYPAELRGILIRVRNVAIGEYDPAFLKYEIVEGFRFDWLSAEVYVDEGLEDALNIDRNSFNEVHPHYLALQREIHRILRDVVFPEARRAAEEGRNRHAHRLNVGKDRILLEAIEDVLGSKYQLVRSEAVGSEEPVTVDLRARLITIHPHPIWPGRRTEKDATEKVVLAHVLAQQKGTSLAEGNALFLNLLRKVFSA